MIIKNVINFNNVLMDKDDGTHTKKISKTLFFNIVVADIARAAGAMPYARLMWIF